jgi:hypothetical protein
MSLSLSESVRITADRVSTNEPPFSLGRSLVKKKNHTYTVLTAYA